MGGYGGYVWPAFGVTALVLVGCCWRACGRCAPGRTTLAATATRARARTRGGEWVKPKHKRLIFVGLGLGLLGARRHPGSDRARRIPSSSSTARPRWRRSGVDATGGCGSAAWSRKAACSAAPAPQVRFRVTDLANTVAGHPTPAFFRTCSARARAWSSRGGMRDGVLRRRPGAGQARRELHAAGGRRRAEEVRAVAAHAGEHARGRPAAGEGTP